MPEWSPDIGLDYKVLNQSFHNQIIKHHKWQIEKKTKVTQWMESTFSLLVTWESKFLSTLTQKHESGISYSCQVKRSVTIELNASERILYLGDSTSENIRYWNLLCKLLLQKL